MHARARPVQVARGREGRGPPSLPSPSRAMRAGRDAHRHSNTHTCKHTGNGSNMKRATYAELESIDCNLDAFPSCNFFRVEVGAWLARGPLCTR